ncbi:MAG TPA: PEP-CTERM sorting domain-containing protein [Burkholderiaceae bacterium]|nr:PEP-CTERM sorting domain-containing protein [Burkholderiaceae bacterium]
MLKKLMCILVLVGAAASAPAQTVWDFSYKGFFNSQSNQFEPQWTESGQFSGADGNGNGLLELQELTRFKWSGGAAGLVEYIVPFDCPYSQCKLDTFSYNLHTGQLNFSSEWSYSDEISYNTSRTVTGDRISIFFSGGAGAAVYGERLWTAETSFNIIPAPVPEPSTALMLAVGIGTLGFSARRIRRSPANNARGFRHASVIIPTPLGSSKTQTQCFT